MRELVLLAVVVFGLYGYGMNIVKLAQADFTAPYGDEVIRSAGMVVVPLGVIAGYLEL